MLEQDKEKLVPMTSIEFRGLCYIEEYWERHGSFPKQINVEGFDILDAMQKESFIRGLFNRGITPPDSNNPNSLSDSQLTAIMTVVDINDKRTINSKLKSMGISTQTWQGWMRDKYFKDFLHKISSRNFEDALHLAHQGLLSAVEKGDVTAIKYWNQLTGREVSPEVHNARVLIGYVIQIIQTHVKDPDVLLNISRDFERVMRGEKPQPVISIPL